MGLGSAPAPKCPKRLSGAAARSEDGCPQTVNKCRASRFSYAARAKSKAWTAPRLSDQAPANVGENKEANADQGAGDDGAQRGPRYGMSERGAEPGAAAQACRKDKPQGQIELAVNYIPGGRGNRHRELKDLTQSDAGEDPKLHRKKHRDQQQGSARPRQRLEKSRARSDKEQDAMG